MVCPNCQHLYPISNGIPNMVRAPIPPPPSSPIPHERRPREKIMIDADRPPLPPTAPCRARNRLIARAEPTTTPTTTHNQKKKNEMPKVQRSEHGANGRTHLWLGVHTTPHHIASS